MNHRFGLPGLLHGLLSLGLAHSLAFTILNDDEEGSRRRIASLEIGLVLPFDGGGAKELGCTTVNAGTGRF